jgi:hypothetical protein
MLDIMKQLANSEEPCIQFKVRANVLEEDLQSAQMKKLRSQVKKSSRIQALFAESTRNGPPPYHPYAKWYGAHWIMTTLADLGYPLGDPWLVPWREQVYGWLLTKGQPRKSPRIQGRPRRHASMEGNAAYYLLILGLADERTDGLFQGLIQWQWPDGGWNCDPRPEAHCSSFHESLAPLRALALHARLTGNEESRAAAKRAAELFLKRRMFRRQKDGQVIKEEFLRLHYPCYWHYDILYGLKVMAEAGFINDARCNEALDLLQSKRLPDATWPAEKKYYHLSKELKPQRELVDWGPVGKRCSNEFVTVDVLSVLKAAHRFN